MNGFSGVVPFGDFPLPIRFNASDAFFKFGVCGEKAGNARSEKHVTAFVRLRRFYSRPFGQSSDLLQRTRDSLWVASELYGGSICKEFPLTTDCCLDQTTEKGPDVTDDQHAYSCHKKSDPQPSALTVSSPAT